ncbi:enhancer of mRNA-decapping protein 4-like [Babylonia areolata]|uniref:enhancer of mRNA-decapping protein 4-like n=1 Tax=Babylonia areolata TaxID=304850 RepID=UPI003FD374B5
MNNEDGVGSSMNSTDTSRLLRELEYLNNSGSSATLQGTVNSSEIGGSGDATITQLMQTMYNPQPKQKIVFTGNDEEENSFGVYGQEVDIYVAPSENEDNLRAGSNKVKIKTVVTHMWEQRYYYGNLVAVHQDGDFVAFSIKTKDGSAIRIMHNTATDRKLIKGFAGNVVDVSFAHSPEAIVAAVDDLGSLLVFSCKLSQQGVIIPTPLLHIKPADDKTCQYNRVIWCPYWPEEVDENDTDMQDSSKVLACTHGGQIDLLAVDVVTRDCGPGPLNPADIESGKITLVPHTEPVVEAVFSPDGSALASASLDGEVKFFQINWTGSADAAECLHEWKPHGGQPLSFFTFLDDLKNMSPDAQFWKFAITGCNKNQELKVWSCETWNCLQTVRFLAPPDGLEMESITLKACIDLSARYIVLSDKANMVMYVLQVYQDAMTCRAHISSVAYFPLTQSCLSFAIIDASTKKFKTSLNDSHLDDITTGELDQEEGDQSQNNTEDDARETMIGVQIRLYAIHPRVLQKLVIHYRPESTVSIQGSAASLSHDALSLRDGLSDVSVGGEASFMESEETLVEDEVAKPLVSPQPKLISPDAFTVSSSSKLVSPSTAARANTTTDEVLSSTSSFTHVTGLTGQNAEDLLLSPASSADQSTSVAAVLSPKSAPAMSPKSVLSPKSPGSVLTPTSTLSPKSMFSTPQADQKDIDQELTPSNIPLPPEEEGELATPKGSHHSDESLQLDALEAFFKPTTSTSSQPPGEPSINTGAFEVDALPKESTGAANTSATSVASTGATDAYDENDQEVAEVLGEDMDKSFSSTGSAAAVAASTDFGEAHGEEEDRPHKPWPRPPDVPTSDQTVPVVSDPLPQTMDEAIITHGTGDGEDDDSEDQNEAEVEEEIEEVLEEADDDEEEEEDEGEDFRKTYQEVVQDSAGSATVKVIREGVDPSILVVLQESIQKLSMEVSRQQEHLCRLQQQIVEQHELQVDLQRQQLEQASLRSAAQPTKDLEQQLGRVQNVVASRVERALSTTLQKETKLLHDRLTASDSRQTSYLDSLQKAVTQTLTANIHKSMETLVKNEFKQSITPVMSKAAEQIKTQLHTDTAQKLAAMETVVKDQISKLVRSRQTTDAISQATSNALHSQGQGMMRDLIESRIIPSFTLTADNMMTQMNALYQQGTSEYFNHLRKQLEKVRQEHESGQDPLIQQLTSMVGSFQQQSQHIHEQLAQSMRHEISHQIKTSFTSFQEQLIGGLRSTIREEVGTALREQGNKMTDSLASYLRSGAATPIPGSHPTDLNTIQSLQEQIKQLVNRGKHDKAFQLALSASNLELVLYVCELVDPGELFGSTPCLLSQPVLLSLIQQLSAELSSSTTTKIRYLTEAMTILDPKDPVTQEHIPVVLEGLVGKLRTYHPQNRDIRLLLMATNSLLSAQ